jgi:hypothetical protein
MSAYITATGSFLPGDPVPPPTDCLASPLWDFKIEFADARRPGSDGAAGRRAWMGTAM